MSSPRLIKIGTRGSRLALWQAEEVQKKLKEAFPDLVSEIVVIKTTGDKILDVALSKIGDKGLFTKELELELLDGSLDIAVHSLKDIPTQLPDGLMLGGVLERGEVRDVFLSGDGRLLSEFGKGDKVGTSSLRRRSQLLKHYPDISVVDIRGNVNSRIQKMQEGYCDGLLMAGAGILRLGLEDLISEYIEPSLVMPAVSQGAVAIEMREDDEYIYNIIDAINHTETWKVVMAERTFLRVMEGGCQVPVACYSVVNGHQIKLDAMVASLDGRTMIRDSFESDLEEASEKAVELALSMLEAGAEDILNSIRDSNE